MEYSDFLSDQNAQTKLRKPAAPAARQQMFCKVALPLPGISQGRRERAKVLNSALKAP